MATQNQCSVCTKALGPNYCTGCDKYFCWRDFKNHREGMAGEMDKIVEERNSLQEAINSGEQSDAQHNPIVEQINRWQENMIEKVKHVAAQARTQAVQLLNSKKNKITTEFRSFSQELANLKESENYVEHELKRLNEKINQFKLDLENTARPVSIKLHTEPSDGINWESMIYVQEVQAPVVNQQQASAVQQVPAPTPAIQLGCFSSSFIILILSSESI